MELLSTFRSSYLVANSPHHHQLPDVVPTSILEFLSHLPSDLPHLLDVEHLLRPTAEMRETLIHIAPDLFLDPDHVPQDAIEHDLDHFPLDLALRLEDEVVDEEIVLVVMVVDDEEAQVIAAIAVMMIGAEAEVVDEVEGEDVKPCGIDLQRRSPWKGKG